ncbi:hypothetical protein [Pseudomonas paeninsulae]|uniref:hypothetical protein n=1 Tax=Pseudomonas paeninsulae TaxID=3110772 RepID=UPI002D795F6C|nr:hypothetical protein [Pseudomonas sp. IT1137]
MQAEPAQVALAQYAEQGEDAVANLQGTDDGNQQPCCIRSDPSQMAAEERCPGLLTCAVPIPYNASTPDPDVMPASGALAV